MNFDWITYNTNPNEIINPDKVIESITDSFYQYNTYMKPFIYENIKYEVTNGGLDEDSFNILGNAPLHEEGVNILNNIDDIKSLISELVVRVRHDLEEEKIKEKNDLIRKIEDRIDICKSTGEDFKYLEDKLLSVREL